LSVIKNQIVAIDAAVFARFESSAFETFDNESSFQAFNKFTCTKS
jgi:hypothetical protein